MVPLCVVVAGRPGSGKTTLAKVLGREIRCLVISRDEVKEGVVNTFGESVEGQALQVRATEAFFEVVEVCLKRGVTVVVEAAFQERVWGPKLKRWREMATVRVVVCEAGAEVSLRRRVERGLKDAEWERFHPDAVVAAAREGKVVEAGEWTAPVFGEGEGMVVGTGEGYVPSVSEIAAFVRGR